MVDPQLRDIRLLLLVLALQVSLLDIGGLPALGLQGRPLV